MDQDKFFFTLLGFVTVVLLIIYLLKEWSS
jgi:hypothetical protein